MENAVISCQIKHKGWKPMLRKNGMILKENDLVLRETDVLTTEEACQYLRISRPTLTKYLNLGLIRGVKAGKGWKVLKSELDRFLKGESSNQKQ